LRERVRGYARRRTGVPRWVKLAAGLGLGLLLAWLPSPFLVLSPGRVFDLADIIAVPGSVTGGRGVGMVTVAACPGRAWEVALALLHPWREVVWGRSLPLPVEQYMAAERALFTESAQFAAAAALSLVEGQLEPAGKGILVQWVSRASPLASRLRPGDVLEGYPTTFHLRRELGERGFALVRVSGGKELRVRADDLRGVGLASLEPVVPGFPLQLKSQEVGGPSGGLACGLEILRQLGKLDIPAGVRVVATGSLDPAGEVGRTGGVDLKARAAWQAGADLFLVPAQQEEEARRAAPGLRVVGVTSLTQAVAAVQALR